MEAHKAAQEKASKLQEGAAAKAAAKARRQAHEDKERAAAERAPSSRTVHRRAWSDWDKLRLGEDEEDVPEGKAPVEVV